MRIGGLREQPDGAYLVIAAPPVSQSGTPLAADDFAVTVGGEEVASEARPRDPADLTVAIVLQAGVSAEDLAGASRTPPPRPCSPSPTSPARS